MDNMTSACDDDDDDDVCASVFCALYLIRSFRTNEFFEVFQMIAKIGQGTEERGKELWKNNEPTTKKKEREKRENNKKPSMKGKKLKGLNK